MTTTSMEAVVRQRWSDVSATLDERRRRLWAATEARAGGRGGVSLLARVTGLSRPTIYAGLKELADGVASELPVERVRRRGGGRRPITQTQPGVLAALETLVEPTSRGDPESPLRWTCKGVRRLAAELQRQNFRIGRQKVADLLRDLDYSLQGNRKTREGNEHPDRNAQFEYIAATITDVQSRGQPVISVDTKKKELVGPFKNGGREWRPVGQPEEVRVHDFLDEELGKAIPYGVYDLHANEGWVSVGINHDTAEFATATIQRWWQRLGQPRYPEATELLILCDGGGSNGSRLHLWKLMLQQLADRLHLKITVRHYPPGTSKWNKIEHRLFSQITQNWRGQPLTSLQVIINLIAKTTTETGLKVHAELDSNTYATGRKVTQSELQSLNLTRDTFHGEWNYSLSPNQF
jgi:hypothetical protein